MYILPTVTDSRFSWISGRGEWPEILFHVQTPRKVCSRAGAQTHEPLICVGLTGDCADEYDELEKQLFRHSYASMKGDHAFKACPVVYINFVPTNQIIFKNNIFKIDLSHTVSSIRLFKYSQHEPVDIIPSKFEPPHDKTNKMTCAPSEDSDQPGHSPSLIRVFAVRFMSS